MRKIAALSVLFVLTLGFFAFAAVTGAEAPKGEEPLLITNAGQGPGGKMGRLLVTRSEAVKDMTYNAEPKPEDLEKGGYKTMLVVIGSSAKGLGASRPPIRARPVKSFGVMFFRSGSDNGQGGAPPYHRLPGRKIGRAHV